MRILFMHHGPLDASRQGSLVRGWAESLAAAGHEARVLLVDHRRDARESFATRSVVCHADDPTADLKFGVPSFRREARPPASIPFRSLSNDQLRAYRDQMRRYLDTEVDQFDPHVVHAQHVWIGAQLALETGVPYVASGWHAELEEYGIDDRFRHWAEQAAENAARILAEDEALSQALAMTFELPTERLLVTTPEMLASDKTASQTARTVAAQQLAEIYQTVLDDRFGH
jgi:hypothetical protein